MECKVLVANRSKKERKNIIRSLNEIGVRDIVEATDNEKAMELAQQGKFAAVFTEFSTEIGQGEDWAKAVRKIDSNLPIIVTAPKSKKMEELKKAYPTASTYLMMPFTTEQLRKTVDQYVPSLAV
jgi:two-component system, chemotaxis family, chemotaxis protein CheY